MAADGNKTLKKKKECRGEKEIFVCVFLQFLWAYQAVFNWTGPV